MPQREPEELPPVADAMPVAAAATASDCSEIILPITPPAEFAAAIKTGSRLS